jgi:hypothetical protein
MASEENPHYFATNTKDDTTIDQITDAVDFPHTGLIKALSLGMKGNYAVKGSATDYDITQASSGNVLQVAAGKIFRDGAFLSVAAKNFTASDFQATANTFHLLVADSASPPVLQIRKHGSSTQNKVPPYTEGDTIIAIITYTSDGFNDMLVQYLTTGKVANNVSIGYDSSGYNEAMSIEGNATRTLFKNKVADADIRFVLADNTADEKFEIYSDDDSDGDEGDTAIFVVTGEGNVGIGEASPDTMLHLTDLAGASPTIKIENTGTDANEPELIFQRTGTAGPSQDIGHIKFKAKDDGGATHIYGSIFSDAIDETAGEEDGRLIFNVCSGGTDNVEIFKLSGNEGVVINDQSNDINFRVESNDNANMLFVDAGNNNVGIGTNSNDANAVLTVEGAISLDEISAPSNTADRGQLFTNADNQLHFIDGDGASTVLLKGGKHSLWIPAEGISPRSNAGCAELATTAAATTGRPDIRALGFDSSSDEHAQFTIAMPRLWNEGTITAQFYWTNAAATSGTVAWGLQGVSLSNDDAIDTAFGTAVVTSDTQTGTAKDVHVSSESSAITIGGSPTAGDLTCFQVYRDVSADNLAEDALLLGIKLFYTIDAGNEV